MAVASGGEMPTTRRKTAKAEEQTSTLKSRKIKIIKIVTIVASVLGIIGIVVAFTVGGEDNSYFICCNQLLKN